MKRSDSVDVFDMRYSEEVSKLAFEAVTNIFIKFLRVKRVIKDD